MSSCLFLQAEQLQRQRKADLIKYQEQWRAAVSKLRAYVDQHGLRSMTARVCVQQHLQTNCSASAKPGMTFLLCDGGQGIMPVSTGRATWLHRQAELIAF